MKIRYNALRGLALTACAALALFATASNVAAQDPEVMITSPSQNDVLTTDSVNLFLVAKASVGELLFVNVRLDGEPMTQALPTGVPLANGWVGYYMPYTGLADGAHTLKAFPVDANGFGYAIVDFTVDTTPVADTVPPTIPGSLSLVDATDTTITVSWGASTDNVGVDVYKIRYPASDGHADADFYVAGNDTEYTLTGLTANTGYRLKVKAIDAAENASAYTAYLDVTTTDGAGGGGGGGGGGDLITYPNNNATFNAGDVTVTTSVASTFYLNGYEMEMSGNGIVATESNQKTLHCRNLQGGTYTVEAVSLDGSITDSVTFTVNHALKSGQFNMIRLNDNKPVIGLDTFAEVGATKRMYLQHYEDSDMNGPTCIRIPDWVTQKADPSAKYYVYFAHHTGRYIRMAWAANIEGPYHLYNAGANIAFEDSGVLALQHYPSRNGEKEWSIDVNNQLMIYDHIASPVPLINHDTQQIELYFHGKKSVGGSGAEQVTFVAYDRNGLNFNGTDFEGKSKIQPVAIGHYYLAPFDWGGYRYGMENSGAVSRTYKKLSEHLPNAPVAGDNPYGETIWDRNFGRPLGQVTPPGAGQVRHNGPLVEGNKLYLFHSYMSDTPEQLYYADFDMVADEKLRANNRYDLATAEAGWEGGQLKIEASGTGAARERVNQLRDPSVFVDTDGTRYIFYSGGGEKEIGLGRLVWVD